MASQAIKSSFIIHIEHLNWCLTVEFKPTKKEPRKRFRYSGVPFSEYLKIATSATPGKYYRENIKGKYISKKLNPNQA